MNDWHFFKVCVSYFKILWLLRSIRNFVGNPLAINCRSERNRRGECLRINRGLKNIWTIDQWLLPHELSSKSARLKLVLRFFFLVIIRHLLSGLPLFFLSQMPVQFAICFMRKKKMLSAKIESGQRPELGGWQKLFAWRVFAPKFTVWRVIEPKLSAWRATGHQARDGWFTRLLIRTPW